MNIATKQTNMSKSADYYDLNSLCDLVYINSSEYKEIKDKCKKNKSKSCIHIIKGIATEEVFMDELNRMWINSWWDKRGGCGFKGNAPNVYVKLKAEAEEVATKQTNMSKPQSFYRENTTQSIEVPELEFNEIKAKCNKNKSKSCFHKNLYPNGILKAKYYMDDEGAIWLKDIVDNDFIEIFYNTPDADDIESEVDWELVMDCIKGNKEEEEAEAEEVADQQTDPVLYHMSRSSDYYDTHSTCDLVYIYSPEYKKIKDKCNKNTNNPKYTFHFIQGIRVEVFMDELDQMWIYSHWDRVGPRPNEYVKLYDNGEDSDTEEEEEKEEYEYTAYGSAKLYKVVINVAGGGMMNGNAYANIEGEWKTEDDFNDGEAGKIYYCEYGSNPSRRCVGTRIIWGEEGFNVK